MKTSLGNILITSLLSILGVISIPNITMAENMNIVYIEASTGARWKLKELPKRTGNSKYNIDFYAIYDFDKSKVLTEVLEKEEKPDVIVIQECSVYFPGPLDSYKEKYQNWILQIKNQDIKPIIATTVPPAESQGIYQDTKDFIKEKLLGRPSQYEEVIQFNEWLRTIATQEGVELIDLEKELRIDDNNRHMNSLYDSGDGIHLNQEAYKKLDNLLESKLDTVQ